MKKGIRRLLVTSVVCLLPMLAGLLLYARLPADIPIHWNANGEVDNTASKAFAVFAMPAILCGLNLVVHVVLGSDPKRRGASKVLRGVGFWAIPVLSLLSCSICYLAALGVEVPVSVLLPVLLGLMIIVIGNYLPKCRQNYTVGIKLPWTLHSEENWNRTHRFAGYVWMIGGAIMMLVSFFSLWYVQVGVILLLALLPCVYSFVLYKKRV